MDIAGDIHITFPYFGVYFYDEKGSRDGEAIRGIGYIIPHSCSGEAKASVPSIQTKIEIIREIKRDKI